MLVVSDDGLDMVNTDMAFAWSVYQLPDATWVLVGHGFGVQSVSVKGGQSRCEAGAVAIRETLRAGKPVLDMRDVPTVGQRPSVSVVEQRIVLPGNGEGQR